MSLSISYLASNLKVLSWNIAIQEHIDTFPIDFSAIFLRIFTYLTPEGIVMTP